MHWLTASLTGARLCLLVCLCLLPQELEARSRALADVTEQLRDSERARVEALGEVVTLRDRVALLTREVARARSVAEAVGAAARPPAAAGREELRRSVEADRPQSWAYGAAGGRAAGAEVLGRHRPNEDEPIAALEVRVGSLLHIVFARRLACQLRFARGMGGECRTCSTFYICLHACC